MCVCVGEDICFMQNWVCLHVYVVGCSDHNLVLKYSRVFLCVSVCVCVCMCVCACVHASALAKSISPLANANKTHVGLIKIS